MYALVEIAILNAIAAGALALVVLCISRWLRRPAVIHALWVLVLLKLVTPPIIAIPIGLRLERLASLAESRHREQPARVGFLLPVDANAPIVVTARLPSAHPAPASVPQSSHLPAIEHAASETREAGIVAIIASSIHLDNWFAIAIPGALCVWVAGTIAWFSVQCWRIALFARLASTARLASEDVQRQAARLASSIGARPRRKSGFWM